MKAPGDSVRKKLIACCLPALRRLPAPTASRLIATLGELELWVNPVRRLHYARAVRESARRLGWGCKTQPVARRLAGNALRWHARDALLDDLPDESLENVLTVSGREHLDAAASAGKGIVLLFNHFGPFLIPAYWLVREGYPLRWFTERPRHVSRLVEATFSIGGPLGQDGLFLSRKLTPSQGGTILRRAVRILGAGMIVQAAGDVRWAGARCVTARFLDRDYQFTTNWVVLAARSGAPVLPVYSLMNQDGTYRIEFLPPEWIGPKAAAPALAAPWVQRNLTRLESYVKQYPDNSGDYFFWNNEAAPA
jgi:KDO2-lipid IV(A) lauroyltransferase